jgi:hypothetical protein
MMWTNVSAAQFLKRQRKAANMTATMLRERFARFGVGLRARVRDLQD